MAELLGSPDEVYYYQLADLWNSIEPNDAFENVP